MGIRVQAVPPPPHEASGPQLCRQTPHPDRLSPLLQFCTAVRKIVCSRTSSYLTALCGVGVMLYLGYTWTALLPLLASFTIWMAA